MRLIHYGDSTFDPSKFDPIKNEEWIKPTGGLWTSPIDSNWGWLDYCKFEGFRLDTLGEFFTLDFNGKVFTIDSEADAIHLPWVKYGYWWAVDFEKLVRMKYDAIHLTERGQSETRHTAKGGLYGWDCESVLLLTLNGVIPCTT